MRYKKPQKYSHLSSCDILAILNATILRESKRDEFIKLQKYTSRITEFQNSQKFSHAIKKASSIEKPTKRQEIKVRLQMNTSLLHSVKKFSKSRLDFFCFLLAKSLASMNMNKQLMSGSMIYYFTTFYSAMYISFCYFRCHMPQSSIGNLCTLDKLP